MLQMLMVTLQKQQEQIDMFMNQASSELNQMKENIIEQNEAQQSAAAALENQVIDGDNEEMIDELAQAL